MKLQRDNLTIINRIVACIWPALFLGTLLFLTIPLEIFKNNMGELGSPLPFFFKCSAALLIFLALTALISSFLKKNTHNEVFSKLLFLCGLFLLMSDFCSPLNTGVLETGFETPDEPGKGVLLEAILFFFLVIIFFKSKGNLLSKLSLPVGVGLLFVEIASILMLMLQPVSDLSLQKENSEESKEVQIKGNVYHLIFDAFDTAFFQQTMQEMQVIKDFKGFTYYPNAKNNYLATQTSLPSFTTGRLFTGKTGLQEWLEDTKKMSILNTLQTSGYHTTYYSPLNNSWHYPADTVVLTPISLSHIADLSVLRAVPTFLRQEVFFKGKGVISKILEYISPAPAGDIRSFRAYNQYKRMVESEESRKSSGEYVFAHFMLPHKPYLMTRSGEYNPAISEESKGVEQLLLATKMMADFIKELKRLGRFHNSMIVFQSDHGAGLASTLRKNNHYRLRPLLLIKPPAAKQDNLIYDINLVQLLDIPDTVYKLTNIKTSAPDSPLGGHIMPYRDKVNIYQVFIERSLKGEKLVFGNGFKKTDMEWITLNKYGQRTDQKPIPVKW